MCPVDPVCHQLTCHRRLFSLSCARNRRFIALFMPIDFAISDTPTSQRTLFTYLWYAWRQSWRCAKYSNSVYVAAFHEFSPCVRWPRAWSPLLTFNDGRRQFTMCRAVVSLNSQKLLSCATGVRLRIRFSLTVTVTIRVRVSVSVYSYGSAWSYGFALKLEGKHRTFWWQIKTQLLSTPPLISFPHTIDMDVSGGRGSHYVNKGRE